MDIVSSEDGGGVRDYRKGNWSVEEMAVLLEAKKMEMKRGKAAELRWKWVEEYCWRRGCCRSQNQCNDKWDNLMRDFKKVREYHGGYWGLEKSERKEKGLPLNMLPQIYEALIDLTEKNTPTLLAAHPPSPPLRPPSASDQPTFAFSQPLPTLDSDRSESESPAKRRKREGTSGAASGTSSSLEEIGIAISKSARIIAEAIESNEEREREMMSVHEIEESKAEINRRGINSLVDAINRLAHAIFAVAHTHQQHSSK